MLQIPLAAMDLDQGTSAAVGCGDEVEILPAMLWPGQISDFRLFFA